MKEDDLKGKETINSVIRQNVDEVSYGRKNLELRWANMLERKGRKVHLRKTLETGVCLAG